MPASQADSSGGESDRDEAANSDTDNFLAADNETGAQLQRGQYEDEAPERQRTKRRDGPANLRTFGDDPCVHYYTTAAKPIVPHIFTQHLLQCLVSLPTGRKLYTCQAVRAFTRTSGILHTEQGVMQLCASLATPSHACRLREQHPARGHFQEPAEGGRRKVQRAEQALAWERWKSKRRSNAAAGGAGQATVSAPASPSARERTATPEAPAPAAVQPPNFTAAARQAAAPGGASVAVEVVSLLNDSEPQSQDAPGGLGADATEAAAAPRVWLVDSEPQSEEQGFGPDAPPRARSQRQALLSESDDEGGPAPEPAAPPDEMALGAASAQHALGGQPSLVSAGETSQEHRLQSAAAMIGVLEPCQSPNSQHVLASPGSVLAMSPASSPLPDRENSTPNVAAAATPSGSKSQQLPGAGTSGAANTDGGAISMHSADAAHSPAAPAGSPVACSGWEADADDFGLVMSPYATKLHRAGVDRRKSRH